MNLAQFPRRRYTEGFTPIEAMPRFSRVLGGPNIYIKRDDLLGLSAGGNKTRKLGDWPDKTYLLSRCFAAPNALNSGSA